MIAVRPIPAEVDAFAHGHTRNKIVFCRDRFAGLDYLDVGLELSRALRTSRGERDAAGLFGELIGKPIWDELIGDYTVLGNLGILFEPSLCINLKMMLDGYSVSRTLILVADGTVSDKRYRFMDDPRWSIDLSGLSYLCTY